MTSCDQSAAASGASLSPEHLEQDVSIRTTMNEAELLKGRFPEAAERRTFSTDRKVERRDLTARNVTEQQQRTSDENVTSTEPTAASLTGPSRGHGPPPTS
ncbi:uncharacterized protein V6R79_001870 [Siganus canaliculatus]